MLKALSCCAGSSAVQQANFATGPLSSVETFSGWGLGVRVGAVSLGWKRCKKRAQDVGQGWGWGKDREQCRDRNLRERALLK